jgi:hypothetical protein
MLLALLAAASAQPVPALTPATATVRIVRAAEIRTDHLEATDESVKRTSVVREPDGTLRTATLIEFY